MAGQESNQAFIGPGGSGKTYLALKKSARSKRIIRVDPNHLPEMKAGAVVIERLTDLMEYVRGADGRKRHIVCYRGGRIYGDAKAMQHVVMIALGVGGWDIFADEADKLVPRRLPLNPHMVKLINQGRHFDISLFWTALHLKNIHPELRENTSTYHWMKGFRALYLGYAREELGRKGAETIKALPRFGHVRQIRDGSFAAYNSRNKKISVKLG